MSIFNYREKPGYLKRLKEALKVTKDDLSKQINRAIGRSESPITEAQLDDLEMTLIGSDIGVQTTADILDRIREETKKDEFLTSYQVRRILRRELLAILEAVEPANSPDYSAKPHVILVVGVNGVGKTTTIGKLASQFREEGKSVLICASDTFRAAAVEQLVVWAERSGAEVVKQKGGADPAAVLFDAISASKSRGKDILIVDTAGRLHTKSNLMQELEKMKRIAAREAPGAPHEVLLILDATTGQNGLIQARQFLNTAGVTGVVVTKLDGTAKGGILVAVCKELKIPVLYIGVGERQHDLMPFSPEAFVDSLVPADPS